MNRRISIGLAAVLFGVLALSSLSACQYIIKAKVSGKILLQAEGGGAFPIQGVEVGIYDSKGIRVDAASSDMNGSFDFPNRIPAGTYKIKVEGAALGLAFEPFERTYKIFKASYRVQIKLTPKKRTT